MIIYGKTSESYNDDDLLKIYEKLAENIFERLNYKHYDLETFEIVEKELHYRGCLNFSPFLGRGQGYSKSS